MPPLNLRSTKAGERSDQEESESMDLDSTLRETEEGAYEVGGREMGVNSTTDNIRRIIEKNFGELEARLKRMNEEERLRREKIDKQREKTL